jgi:SnoaL-like domain
MKKTTVLAFICASALSASSTWAAGKLTAEDYFEIEQLYAQYNIAIDGGDAEGYAATFTPDGVFNTFTGKEALIGFVHAWRERLGGAARKHWNTNLRITGDSQQASGSVYLMLLDISTKPVSVAGTATYTDMLVKTKQGWRFTKRTTKGDVVPPPVAGPAAPAGSAPAPAVTKP